MAKVPTTREAPKRAAPLRDSKTGTFRKREKDERVFQTIIDRGIRAGIEPARTKAARDWYRGTARAFNVTKKNAKSPARRFNDKKLMTQHPDRLTTRPKIGNMYMFYYDPKHKKTLPYYDMFPLVFPFKKTPNGFLGINLHYLPLFLRGKLMDGLYNNTNNKKYNETTKIRMNYALLTSAAELKYFRPTIKRYLTKHLRSKFLWVHPEEWDIAISLPVERFEKKRKVSVWADSKKIIAKKG